MKLKTQFVFAALALLGANSLQAQTIINLTGATAFRDAAHGAIIGALGGDGVAWRARTDLALPGGTGNSNLRIYRGFIGGEEYIVRATFSGSTQGILDLADQNDLYFLKPDTIMTQTSTGALTGLTVADNTEIGKAGWSFSDVEKTLSDRPLASLGGGPVGVVPFMFVAGKGSPAGITNMTDQLHEALWSAGQVDSSFLGLAGGTTLLATGRSNGSGTRATILAETGYGPFRQVVQYGANTTTGAITPYSLDNLGGGQSSNSGVRAVLEIDRALLNFGGSPVNALFVSYLTVSDAIAATGYNVADGTSDPAKAVPMTYNGVRYSEENVQSGAYTLWGYQQLYTKPSLTTLEAAFDATLRTNIGLPANLGNAGIASSTMTVTRVGGDGGAVLPNAVEE